MQDSIRLPNVSVFMTTYQQEGFVSEAIESVINQEDVNMELIIGDDGSTDGTQKILIAYQKKYPDLIKLILSENNAGITANCNKIFKECKGDYIAFQAGDDVWLPGKLEEQVDYMEKHPECSICYHNLEVFDNDSGAILGNFNNPENPPRIGKADTLIRYGCFNGAISNMVRRSNCPSHGFDTRIPIASDWLFWIETLLDNGKIHYIDKVLGRYRIRKNSVSNRKTEEILNNFADHLNTLNILLLKRPKYRRDIFFRMFDIYDTVATFDPPNMQSYKEISSCRKYYSVLNAIDKLVKCFRVRR